MARSAAEVQEAPKKKKTDEVLQQINQMLDQALKARTFSPETLKEFEVRGNKVREERDMTQITPTPQKTRVATVVPTREMEMTRPAIVASLKLAETLELAGSARTLNIRPWVEAGRMA
jgi:hypothetical protein